MPEWCCPLSASKQPSGRYRRGPTPPPRRVWSSAHLLPSLVERAAVYVAAGGHGVNVLVRAEGGGAGEHALHPVAQIVVVGRSEECVQIRDRLGGEQLLDDRRNVGR